VPVAGELQTALLSEARDWALYAAVPGMGTAAAAMVLAIDGLNSLLGRKKAPKLLGATPKLDQELLEAAAREWNPALYRNAVSGQYRMLRLNKATILKSTPTGQRWLRYDALREQVNEAYTLYLKRERDPDRAQALAMALRAYILEGWPLPNLLADAFALERSKWTAPPSGSAPLVTVTPANVTTMPVPTPASGFRVTVGYGAGSSSSSSSGMFDELALEAGAGQGSALEFLDGQVDELEAGAAALAGNGTAYGLRSTSGNVPAAQPEAKSAVESGSTATALLIMLGVAALALG